MEIHMINNSRPILDPIQSPLQFGFTRGCSPLLAALVLTEIIADAKDSKQELLITFMDTSKAFDVVNHVAMLNSLNVQGIQGNLWKNYNNMYSDIKSIVKWEGEHSHPFNETQGIRQGGSSSADIYKASKNNLLTQLQHASTNHIGHLSTGAFMVADDLLLASPNIHNMQASINIAQRDAAREQYNFNCDKTKYIKINNKNSTSLTLNSKPLGLSTCEPHLGIHRNTNGNNEDTIQSRISAARRTVMSLLGAGLRGYYGTGPYAGALKYKTYVLPILIYGLEVLVLSTTEIKILEKYHRQNIRCLLHLPTSTAVEALHFLSGIPPIEGEIHIKALSTFRNIIAIEMPSPPLLYIRELIIRQMTMKTSQSSSWTTYIKSLLIRYNLPSVSNLLNCTPSKREWKKTIKSAVYGKWSADFRDKILSENKTSLEYLIISNCKVNTLHPIYRDVTCPLAVKKATIKSLLLIKRYPLTTYRFAGTKQREKCPLCNEEPETVVHFLLHCKKLSRERRIYIHHILSTLRTQKIDIQIHNIVAAILDTTYLPVPDLQHEKNCRNFVFKLHNRRALLLGGNSQYKI